MRWAKNGRVVTFAIATVAAVGLIAGTAVAMTGNSQGSNAAPSPSTKNTTTQTASNSAEAQVAARQADYSNENRHVQFDSWQSADDFGTGTFDGTTDVSGALQLKSSSDSPQQYTDTFGTAGSREYVFGSWTSPVVELGFPADEAVSSWNADTETGTWVQVDFRGRHADGSWTKWYVMAQWTAGNEFDKGDIHRTSVDGQQDSDGTIYTDTFSAAAGKEITAHQTKVTLYRPAGTKAKISVSLVGTMASAIPASISGTSPFLLGHAAELDVPRFSQEIHAGEYPEYAGGGEAWCSPTSSTMVLYYWDKSVAAENLEDIVAPNGDPQVDWAAMHTYDFTYGGAGNWPFNAAYTSTFGLNSFVTRLRDLSEAEKFIEAGIPLVVSVSFSKAELPEAGYSTNGHLLTIIGFTADGDVIINDPAADSNDDVRRVYPRDKFEKVWANKSGGITYVTYPEGTELPEAVSSEKNW